ncbi:hypothetical protein Pcinc_039059 [Petrolisthes cinctipes]|uniref:Uncharacterized protein n=1 Tax=Petrolisthes cinctipes TaxID=88211 RepID=A0AAE1BPQ3_PETCI|nr:hypothetical protein Pcinc_039059 [Petrolisthes cinctipes]
MSVASSYPDPVNYLSQVRGQEVMPVTSSCPDPMNYLSQVRGQEVMPVTLINPTRPYLSQVRGQEVMPVAFSYPDPMNYLSQVRGQEVMPVASSCPDPLDIVPCVCSGVDPDLDLDCSLVGDEEQLGAVFEAYFPVPAFRRLTITDNDNIQVL